MNLSSPVQAELLRDSVCSNHAFYLRDQKKDESAQHSFIGMKAPSLKSPILETPLSASLLSETNNLDPI